MAHDPMVALWRTKSVTIEREETLPSIETAAYCHMLETHVPGFREGPNEQRTENERRRLRTNIDV